MATNGPNRENHIGGNEHAEMIEAAWRMVPIAATFEDFPIQMAMPVFHYMLCHASY
jgi:hypothetical protein